MKSIGNRVIEFCFVLLLSFNSCSNHKPETEKNLINDITQLNPIKVVGIIAPTTNLEIINVIKMHTGPISIGGGRFSMGGQTATEGAIQIDMRKFNRIVSFSKQQKEITVQAGIRWRELIEFIDNITCLLKLCRPMRISLLEVH